MKQLLSGVALAALIAAAVPVLAQTPMTPAAPAGAATTSPAAPPAAAAETPPAGQVKQRPHRTTQVRRGGAAGDSAADRLNRQELGRIGTAATPAPAPAYPPAYPAPAYYPPPYPPPAFYPAPWAYPRPWLYPRPWRYRPWGWPYYY